MPYEGKKRDFVRLSLHKSRTKMHFICIRLIFIKEVAMGLLDGKTALIFGLANERSIAWGITKAFHEQGATLGISYAG